MENEKKVKKRKQEDDSDYEEREVNITLLNNVHLHFGFGLLLTSYFIDPGKETKEEDKRGKESHHWREKESQKRARGEVEMVRLN